MEWILIVLVWIAFLGIVGFHLYWFITAVCILASRRAQEEEDGE